MKKVLTKFVAMGSIGLLMLSACKKDGVLVTSNGGKAGTLSSTSTNLVLDKSKLNDTSTIINFSFTAPSFGYSAAVTNTLQIDVPSDNWKSPASATLNPNAHSQGYATSVFNSLLLKLNLPGGAASQINVRIQHTISASVAPIYSNTVNMTVTPFNLASFVYVVGAFDGWPPLPASGTDSLISATSNGIYTGIINFPANANQFLILPQSTNYNNKWATNDPQGSTSSTVTVGANNNFYAPATAGEYWVTLNLNTNTISFAAADYYSIVGNAAQGWGTDVDMKYVNDGNQTWVATTPLSVESPPNDGWKIRKDHAWGTSYGTIATPDGKSLTSSNGVNIGNAVAGTYNITFWLNPADNTGTTAFYSAVKQ